MVNIMDVMQKKNVAFIATHDAIDYTTPAGKFMMHIMSSMAEFERALIIERVNTGLAYAKSRGIKLGRPPVLVGQKVGMLIDEGHTYDQVAALLNVGRSTVYRKLRERL
jgi:DNA invertase Pin-like site-specific DNA recombinase